MDTVALCNLGCSKNIVDGERIIAHMEALGFGFVEDPADAGVIVVNTCAFIKEAKQEAIASILEMAGYKKRGRCRVLAVAGCFAQRYRNEAQRLLPEVDLWMGLSDWAHVLARFFHIPVRTRASRHLTGLAATQYLKISDGCSHRCAFCAIPLIRGRFRSRRVEPIVKEAQWLEQRGVRECILVSQDTSFYGRDIGTSLVRLLERLLKKTSFPWLRLMYLHPRYIDTDLLRLVASEKRLCSYFDMPLQHIADPVLTAMRRSPNSAETKKLIERIRTTVPEAALRTAFVVGFPGESEAHFTRLVRFVEWARFDKLGVFPFSPEEGTAAYAMPHRPRGSTANRRCEEIMSVQREISRELLQKKVGATLGVMVDRHDETGACECRTEWDAPEIDGVVSVRGCRANPGSIVKVKITGAGDYDLTAVAFRGG